MLAELHPCTQVALVVIIFDVILYTILANYWPWVYNLNPYWTIVFLIVLGLVIFLLLVLFGVAVSCYETWRKGSTPIERQEYQEIDL